MAETKEVKILINADSRGAVDGVNTFKNSLGDIAKVAAGIGLERIGEAAIQMGKDFVVGSINASNESEKMVAQLDAVLKSTAGVVNQGDKWVKTGGMSAATQSELNERLKDAKARLADMEERWKKTDEHTQSATRSLEKARNEVQNLEGKLKNTTGTLVKMTGATQLSRDELLKLSSDLQKLTTYSDETVLSAENMLLTFTNISKNVFPEATQTVLDMSTALGQDTKASAIQLGKALQDPIDGVTALKRVGVNFTDEQREQIKVMVESGKTIEAQKFILKELSTEFGGSAAAAANTFDGKILQLKNGFDDLQETIGKVITDSITPFIDKLSNGIKDFNIKTQLKNLLDILTGMKPTFDAVITDFRLFGEAVGTFGKSLGEGDIVLKVYATSLSVIALGISNIVGIAGILVLKIDQIAQAMGMLLSKNADDFFQHKQKLIQDQADIQTAWGELATSQQTQIINMNRIWDEHKTKVADVAIQSIKTKDDYTTAFSTMKLRIDTDLPKMNETISTNMSTAAKNTMTSVGQMQSSHATAIEGMKTKTESGFSEMHTSANNWWGKIKGIFDGIMNGISGSIGALSQGTNFGKKATGGYASGLTLVGERGAELVNLPSGSYVHNAESTKGMMGGVTVNFNNPTVRSDNDLQAIISAVKQTLGRENELAAIGAF